MTWLQRGAYLNGFGLFPTRPTGLTAKLRTIMHGMAPRGGPRKGAGRPKAAVTRTTQVSLRLSDVELAWLDTLAHTLNLSRPEALRHLLTQAASGVKA